MNQVNRRPATRGVRVERLGRTSPTRIGSEVPRLNLHVQSKRGGSHGRDYYRGARFGKAGGAAARRGRYGSGGAAADVEARGRPDMVRAALVLRGGNGSVCERALLCPRARGAWSHATHHSGGVRSSVSVIREERRQRCG